MNGGDEVRKFNAKHSLRLHRLNQNMCDDSAHKNDHETYEPANMNAEDPNVDIATYTRESASNRQAYQRLREDIQRTYAGRYVAFAFGRVIGAASSFDAARELVKQLEPAPEYYLVFPANMEPDFDLVYDLSWSF